MTFEGGGQSFRARTMKCETHGSSIPTPRHSERRLNRGSCVVLGLGRHTATYPPILGLGCNLGNALGRWRRGLRMCGVDLSTSQESRGRPAADQGARARRQQLVRSRRS